MQPFPYVTEILGFIPSDSFLTIPVEEAPCQVICLLVEEYCRIKLLLVIPLLHVCYQYRNKSMFISVFKLFLVE